MLGCGFFSLKTWRLFTGSSEVIGRATLTVIGTVLPFSTSGGMSSLTLPVCTTAEPTTFRIALASIAGVASAGRRVTVSIAALPVRARNCRRVALVGLSIVDQAFLFA